MDRLSDFLFAYSHLGVFLALLATGLGVPIPEDIILITGGVVAAQNNSFFLMCLTGLAGVLVGDLIIYGLGYHYGEAILQRRPFNWLVTPDRLRKVRGYYRRYGYWAIFISRFLAGLRATSFLLAGLSHVPLRIFLLADGVAALISVPFFIFLGHYFADDIQTLTGTISALKGDALLIVLAGVVLVLLYVAIRRRRAARMKPGEADEREGSSSDLE